MKRFFQLLLAGLFLMAIGFIAEPKVMSIDDDVGTSEFIDIQQDFEISNEFNFVSDLSYQEVGIVPALNTDISLDHYELTWYKEQLDCIMMNLIVNQIAKSCTNMFYSNNRYEQATNTTKFSGTNEWYCSNNYLLHSIGEANTEIEAEEICKIGNNLLGSWEVIGLVPEPKQNLQNNIYKISLDNNLIKKIFSS